MRSLIFLLLLLPSLVFAMPTERNFQAGRDYQVLSLKPSQSITVGKPVQVVEFFSYGCPACYRLEPNLETWLKSPSGQYAHFERMPVVFHSPWELYAKAYYTAKMLSVESKITPALFYAIHEQQQDLSSADSLAKFFASQGVNQQEFYSIFNFTPGIAPKLNQTSQLMALYQINQVPTVVVNGKYLINGTFVNGDYQKMVEIIDFLVSKELATAKKGK